MQGVLPKAYLHDVKLERCYQNKLLEAGCDEAGRGPLSGPVVGAAVILPNDFHHPLLNDSKQLTEKKRDLLRPIIEKEALSYAVEFIFPKKIDEINILRASFLSIHKALEKLAPAPEFIVMDGNKFPPFKDIPFECIIKGDGKLMNIAAASVLAKTYRDEYMYKIHEEFPMYNWKNNKGYPTKEHRRAILEHGPTKYHRNSFQLIPVKQGELFT